MATTKNDLTDAKLNEAYSAGSGGVHHDEGLRAVAEVEKARIENAVRTYGYDWSHDPNVSGLQHLLNWLDGRE